MMCVILTKQANQVEKTIPDSLVAPDWYIDIISCWEVKNLQTFGEKNNNFLPLHNYYVGQKLSLSMSPADFMYPFSACGKNTSCA